MRFKFVILMGAIAAMTLAGCGKSDVASSPSSTDSSTAPTQTQVDAPATGYPQLLSVVAKTRTAVETGDFETAKQEFDQFEGVWSQVEDGIKDKSASSYDAIEEDMDQIMASLRSSDSTKALDALGSLDSHIQSIPQS